MVAMNVKRFLSWMSLSVLLSHVAGPRCSLSSLSWVDFMGSSLHSSSMCFADLVAFPHSYGWVVSWGCGRLL